MRDFDFWAEIDMSNQIDNSWNKDSVLAIREKERNFSLKIRTEDKKIIKGEFIFGDNSKHDRRVITLVYCFMLYKLLKLSEGFSSKVKIAMMLLQKFLSIII